MKDSKFSIKIPYEIRQMLEEVSQKELRTLNNTVAMAIKFYAENRNKLIVNVDDASINIAKGMYAAKQAESDNNMYVGVSEAGKVNHEVVEVVHDPPAAVEEDKKEVKINADFAKTKSKKKKKQETEEE